MKIKNIFLIFISMLFLSGCTQNTDKITIQFASWGSQSEVEILEPIIAEFEKENPDIKVDFLHIPQNYFPKIHMLFASNMPPDVIFINNLYLPVYANADLLYAFNKNGEIDTSVFYKKSLDALSFNNKLYAIPRDISNLVIYYNKDIFDEYNVDYPNKNWTLVDFLKTAAKLTNDADRDGENDFWGISFEEEPVLFYLPYLMSQGGGILSDDGKKVIFDSPASQRGLKFYADLRNKYHVAPTKAESASATMAQMFLQGRLAMQLSGRWLVPKYISDADFRWDVINFPSGVKGSIVPLDSSGWAIAKASQHKNEAIKLIKFLASKENSENFTKSGLIVPARIDVANGEFLNPTNTRRLPQHNRVFIDIIETSKPTPVSVNYNEIQDILNEKTNYLFNK